MAISLRYDPILNRAEGFLRWWKGELIACIPKRIRSAFDSAERTPLLAINGNVISLVSREDGNTAKAIDISDADAGAQIKALLSRLPGRTKKAAAVRLSLPKEDCFRRELLFPSSARANLDQILKLDIERSTPFKLDEIYHSHHIVDGTHDPTKLTVEHLIVKRNRMDDFVDLLQDCGRRVVSVSAYDDDPFNQVPVNFIPAEPRSHKQTVLGLLNKCLVLLVIGLGTAFVLLTFERQDQAIAELDTKLASAKRRAIAIRKSFDEAHQKQDQAGSAVRRKIVHVGLIDIWEELTRVLPDEAWLADFRVSRDQIQINGFAKASAGLLQILEASPMFAQASFVAPVTMDNRHQRERFSIKVKLLNKQGES